MEELEKVALIKKNCGKRLIKGEIRDLLVPVGAVYTTWDGVIRKIKLDATATTGEVMLDVKYLKGKENEIYGNEK